MSVPYDIILDCCLKRSPNVYAPSIEIWFRYFSFTMFQTSRFHKIWRYFFSRVSLNTYAAHRFEVLTLPTQRTGHVSALQEIRFIKKLLSSPSRLIKLESHEQDTSHVLLSLPIEGFWYAILWTALKRSYGEAYRNHMFPNLCKSSRGWSASWNINSPVAQCFRAQEWIITSILQ